MAIRATGDEGFQRTASALNHNAAYSALVWVRLTNDTNNYIHFFHVGGDIDAYDVNTDSIGTDTDGTSLRMGCAGGSTNSFATVGPIANVAQWYHVALVRESTTALKIYWDGALQTTFTNDVSSRVASAEMSVGTYNAFGMDGRFANVQLFSRALGQAEIQTNMLSYTPSNSSGLWSWAPCVAATVADCLLDISGNARHWSERGTLAIEDGPPILYDIDATVRTGRRIYILP